MIAIPEYVFSRSLLASMKNFTTYLSTAPVVALVWFTITAGLLIEINRFFPDPLVFSL
jgi:photosystem I subunit 9